MEANIVSIKTSELRTQRDIHDKISKFCVWIYEDSETFFYCTRPGKLFAIICLLKSRGLHYELHMTAKGMSVNEIEKVSRHSDVIR